MPEEYAGVLAVSFIVGLVEAAKRLGLNTVWCVPLAVLLGVAMALGLAASGLYSGAKRAGEG